MKKYANFCRALTNLKDVYNYQPPYDNVIGTGLVTLYVICFEQAWKVMKETLEANGFSQAGTGSPRQILKTAYQAGMIKDEGLWLKALVVRNDAAHAYNKEAAYAVIEKTKNEYYKLFVTLKEEIEKNWIIEA